MAQVTQGLSFTGSMSNISAYRMRGSDKIILRAKGGPSKRKIKTLPSFAKTRRNNAEFGGRATATRWIRDALFPLLPLADYNIAGPLNALLKPVQQLDVINKWGERNIELSKQPSLLQGFQLNRRNPIDQIIRNPVTCTLSKKDCSAQIDVPSLVSGINLIVPGNYPYFSFVFALAALPDLVFDKQGYKAVGNAYKTHTYEVNETTAWYLVSQGAPAQSIQLHINQRPPNEAFSLMLSVGIRFGNPGVEKVEQVKYAGAGKVLAAI